MKKLAVFILLGSLLPSAPAAAAWQTFEREFTYEASEADSKISCRFIALEQVKRLLLEELGTYVESTSVVRDFQLTSDEIRTFTAGTVQTSIAAERWNGKQYWMRAQIAADPEEVAALLESVRTDSLLRQELEEARQEAARALLEIEELKKIQAMAAGEKLEKHNEAVNQIMAADWFERGSAYSVSGDYPQAAAAYDRVILLRPADAKGYSSRGFVYRRMGYPQKGMRDYHQAVRLNPRYAKLYYTREIKSATVTVLPKNQKPAESQKPAPSNQERSFGSRPDSSFDPFYPRPRYSTGERPWGKR